MTLFPELLRPWTEGALLGKAGERGLLEYALVNMRDYSGNRHLKVDDTPYGGGAGMVIRADVVERSLEAATRDRPADEVIFLSPAGRRFDQRLAEELARKDHLVLVCGRYEGFDARAESLATLEVSLGDFVMMGGEAAAACILEAVGRLRENVLGDADSHRQDSFSSGLLDYPEYTRPAVWRGLEVPEVLKGGNHAAIERWRRESALRRTLERRPDLLRSAPLTPEDSRTLLELGATEQDLAAWGAPPPPVPKKRRKKKAASENG
nr:tRNA (guanosine(37)-N1)-methyltransferase TrmD [Deinobacterium chartae]